MNNYKATPKHQATPEQWQACERRAANGRATDIYLLDLRARVEALEAQADHFGDINRMVPPPVATDEELYRIWESKKTDNWDRRRDIYNLNAAHEAAHWRKIADPAPVAGGLMEQVSDAITSETGSRWASTEARAAILEVARWLPSEPVSRNIAERLEQEAGR